MKVEDVLDIKAYLATLTPVHNPRQADAVPLMSLVRRGLGLWKLAGFSTAAVAADANQSSWNRGAYLVNGPGHCNECHTPRTLLMASDASRFLAGGPHPDGQGRVPSLRDLIGRKRYKDAADLTPTALQNGELLGYDKLSSGGMGAVQTNLSKLPEADVPPLPIIW
ncbi:MAG: cytochrome c [Hyphomicrobiales bacterium]